MEIINQIKSKIISWIFQARLINLLKIIKSEVEDEE